MQFKCKHYQFAFWSSRRSSNRVKTNKIENHRNLRLSFKHECEHSASGYHWRHTHTKPTTFAHEIAQTHTHTHTNTKRHKNHHHHHRNIHVHNLLKQNRDIDIIIAGRFLSKEIQRIHQRNSVNRSYMYKSKYIQLCHQFASVHTIHWDIETSSRTHMLHNINCILYKLYIQGIHCFLLKRHLT